MMSHTWKQIYDKDSLTPHIIHKIQHKIDIGKLKEYYFANILRLNIHDNNEVIFRTSCKYGRTDIAKWILELGETNIHALDDHAFWEACTSGHTETVKWLISVQEKYGKIENVTTCLLLTVCINSNSNIVRLLLLNFDIEYKRGKDKLFKTICKKGNLEIIEALCDHEPTYNYEIKDGKVYHVINRKINRKVNIVI